MNKKELEDKISYLVSECDAIQISQGYGPNEYGFNSSLMTLGMYQHKFAEYLMQTDFELPLQQCIDEIKKRNLANAYRSWTELVSLVNKVRREQLSNKAENHD